MRYKLEKLIGSDLNESFWIVDTEINKPIAWINYIIPRHLVQFLPEEVDHAHQLSEEKKNQLREIIEKKGILFDDLTSIEVEQAKIHKNKQKKTFN